MPTRSTTTDTVKYLANATTHLFLCHFTVSVGLYCEKKKNQLWEYKGGEGVLEVFFISSFER